MKSRTPIIPKYALRRRITAKREKRSEQLKSYKKDVVITRQDHLPAFMTEHSSRMTYVKQMMFMPGDIVSFQYNSHSEIKKKLTHTL